MNLSKLVAISLVSFSSYAHFDMACWFDDNNYGPDIFTRIDGTNTRIAIDSIRITEDDGDPLFLEMNQIDGRTYQIKKDQVPRILELDYLQLRSFTDLDPHTLMKRFSMNLRYENESTRYKVKGSSEANLVCKVIDINSSQAFNFDYIKEFRNLRKSVISKVFNN